MNLVEAGSVPGYPVVDAAELAWISREDMVEIDRVMIAHLHIGLLQMMENAGRNLARLVLDLISPASVTVCIGSGGNGGGGLVAARHLGNAGVDVRVVTTGAPDTMSPAAAHQMDIVRLMGIGTSRRCVGSDVMVDALIGYTLQGSPRGSAAELITAINNSDSFVVSLDTLSGLDVSTGASPGLVVGADATLTLALPKLGLRNAPCVGDLYVGDISVPPAVALAYGPAPDFFRSPILRIS